MPTIKEQTAAIVRAVDELAATLATVRPCDYIKDDDGPRAHFLIADLRAALTNATNDTHKTDKRTPSEIYYDEINRRF